MVHKIAHTQMPPPERQSPAALRPDEMASAVAFAFSKGEIAKVKRVVARARRAVAVRTVTEASSALAAVVTMLTEALLGGKGNRVSNRTSTLPISHALMIPWVTACALEIFGGAELSLENDDAVTAIAQRPDSLAEFTAALLWARLRKSTAVPADEALKILQFRKIILERNISNGGSVAQRAHRAIAQIDEQIAELRKSMYVDHPIPGLFFPFNPPTRDVIDDQKTGEVAAPDSVDDLVARLEKLIGENSKVSDISREKLSALAKVANEQAQVAQLHVPPLPDRAPLLWSEARQFKENPVQFIRRVYAPWLNNGLTTGDIYSRDERLYRAYAKHVRAHGKPDFDLPGRREVTDRWIAKLEAERPGGVSGTLKEAEKLVSALRRRKGQQQL